MPSEDDRGSELDTERALTEVLTPLVGRYGLHAVVAFVRGTLVHQALGLSSGNKTNAARLLGVTRQAIQQHASDPPSLSGQALPTLQHHAGAAVHHGGAGGDTQLGKDATQVGTHGPFADL